MAASRTVRLGDVVDLVTGFPFKSDGYVDDGHAPRLVRGDNVVQGGIRWVNAKRWPAQSTAGLAKYELLAGDIVLAMDRPWIEAGLKYAAIGQNDVPSYLVQRVARLRGIKGLDTAYLRYVIGSRDFTAYVLAVQTGTAVPHISGPQILDYTFQMPPLDEQRRIAHILGTLDDKIELNRRMSETLEVMARALFKSWFVDFDPVRAKAEGRDSGLPNHLAHLFPDRLVASELGGIPEGWEVARLADVIENHDRKRVPVSGAERSTMKGRYPYHGAAGVLDYVDDYLFDGVYLLVGEDGSVVSDGGFAVTQYVWGEFWVNNHAHVLTGARHVSTEQLLLYFSFEPVAPYVTGAVQAKLSQGRMASMPFCDAGPELCTEFARIVAPWFEERRALDANSAALRGVRDSLLQELLATPSSRPVPAGSDMMDVAAT